MSISLLIETSTERGVIACFQDQEPLFSEELPFGSSQSQYLMPRLAQALKGSQVEFAQLSYIGVGVGPGSYTGIRIGVSVAQALAYSCKIPLAGFCSLDGFIPSMANVCFAAILDARIGGAYVRKGFKSEQGITYLSKPAVVPLEELGAFLSDVSYLLTPSSKVLKAKMDRLYPSNEWKWEEKAPSPDAIAQSAALAYHQGVCGEIGRLELLYLRETEAEREKNKKNERSGSGTLFI